MDGDKQWETHFKPSSDSVRDSALVGDDESLSSFFSRPIVIPVQTWTPFNVSPFGYTFNPWSLFFANKRVSNRMTNFNLLNCTLKVKFMINGNPFYYGRLMADYQFLPVPDYVTDASTLVIENAVAASQRMHIFLDPTTSQGGTMSLPFVFPRDTVSLTAGDWSQLGVINVRELNQLRHANAATTPLEITIAIWAEDVKMSVPTTVSMSGLVAQANTTRTSGKSDEYGKSIISRVASATAATAQSLYSIPFIAPYAKATSMVATAVGSLASLFGFSRPAIVADHVVMRPAYIGSMAVTDVGDTVQKLTVDSKQELSIDPRIVGVDMGDELVLSRLASIQSYIYAFPWTVARVTDYCLYSVRVTPHISKLLSGAYHMPACMFTGRPFKYWRGTMRYRFQIVASQYHKGRLRIVYDPNFINSLEANVAFTRIVDLDVERDVTIDVAWSQPSQFLTATTMGNSFTNQTQTSFGSSDFYCNGVLGVYVLNSLSTPNSTIANDISINVYVSMCEDDCEFAVPDDTDLTTMVNSYAFTPQSDTMELGMDDNAPNTEMPTDCLAACSPSDDKYLVYYGERITSFRQMLKRYCFHSSYVMTTTGATTSYFDVIRAPDFPSYRGYALGNMHVTNGGTFKYNYVQNSLLHYLTPAFVCVRGSLRSKYKLRSTVPNGSTSMLIERGYTGNPSAPTSTATIDTSQGLYASGVINLVTSGYDGMAVTVPEKQPVIEVEFPYYKNVRFDYAKDVRGAPFVSSVAENGHRIVINSYNSGSRYLDRYISVGEDFSLHLFQGAPPMKLLSNPAA